MIMSLVSLLGAVALALLIITFVAASFALVGAFWFGVYWLVKNRNDL
jgi:hypothetical protein